MTEHIRPEFTPGTLPKFNGYHLQIFASGRAKISLQTLTLKKQQEFYTALPKRDREGLHRQKKRSLKDLPAHFAAVDQLLSNHPDAKVFRVHEKGNNNWTADNAHLLASLEQAALWLVMSGVVHKWELTAMLADVLLRGTGKRTGEASIFNEYMPSYEHDWEDATFELADYKEGLRDVGGQPSEVPQLRQSPRPTPNSPRPAPKIESRTTIDPITETAEDYVLDDPDDPAIFTDPPEGQAFDDEDEPFPDQPEGTAWETKTFKGGTAYGKAGLWAAYNDSDKQTGQLPTP